MGKVSRVVGGKPGRTAPFTAWSQATMHMAQVETWIRERAYSIWEMEGRPEGRERQHWEQATRDVMSRGKGSAAQPAAAKRTEKPAAPSRAKTARTRRSAA